MTTKGHSLDLLAAVHRHCALDARLIHLGLEPMGSPKKALTKKPAVSGLGFSLPVEDKVVYLRLEASAEGLTLIAFAREGDLGRILRNVLVPYAELVAHPEEHLRLASFGPVSATATVIAALAGWGQRIQGLIGQWRRITQGRQEPSEDVTLLYWWDERANFGDTAGPWLVSAMSGQDVVNVRRTKSRGRSVATVGSLFQMAAQDRIDFWGTGLLYPPKPTQLNRLRRIRDVKVHAVRGPKTRHVLQSALGWDVPEVYGDPALLFPRYLPVTDSERDPDRIAFIPHQHHRKYFSGELSSRVQMLSVADDVTTVVRAIATSGACISTSLHGVIFAQAYGIPWVWLNVEDDTLKGGDFKFDDFFATLATDQVARVDVTRQEVKSLNLEELAAQATLPELLIDLDQLEKAAPFVRARAAEEGQRGRFSWKDITVEDRLVAHTRGGYRRQRRLRTELARIVQGSKTLS